MLSSYLLVLPDMHVNSFNIEGLSTKEVKESRKKHGQNTADFKKENGFSDALKSIVKEPMILMLLVASSIYFMSGQTGDGFFLAGAIILVSVITLFQDSRSRNALQKLKEFIEPCCKVIRDGTVMVIKSEELVMGDCLLVEEGNAIAADGMIIHSNDFSVNESILTGEALPVSKNKTHSDNCIYQGTTVVSGLAVVTVTAIANATKLGKIGKSLESIKEERTPLELQINNFVQKMLIAGTIVFAIVWAINFFRSYNLLNSLLEALTLAMSILPEEIPFAFTTFMALGAWRLMKMGVVVKQMKTVETLGSATVICTDKTGTITENKMSLAKVFVLSTQKTSGSLDVLDKEERDLITLAMWASEPSPFDPMEVALHAVYSQITLSDARPEFQLVHEYPLGGKPPMMTHVFENVSGKRIIAAKGAPEALIAVCTLSEIEKQQVHAAIAAMANEGYRVIAVGESDFAGNDFPKKQQDLKFVFTGIVAFYDPPKKNIEEVFQRFYKAGISIKIITGDNAATTVSIAKQIGFQGWDKTISGDELMALTKEELSTCVRNNFIFTRMFPEAKLKIIEALKVNREIVAMTGDGVNDGPALKSAHIGIAMGQKGTEIAKQAASLILINDDLAQMVDAIGMGRRIYANLKKAIQYIISIHIPIILTVFIPLVLGWIYPNIFSPIHIIFLELIMGPTCSIIFENEPIEKNSMDQQPRPFSSTFFSWKELATSIVQGAVITLGILLVYQYAVHFNLGESSTRTMVFLVLVCSNIFLTLVNRSFYYSVFTTLKYKNNLVLLIIGLTVFLTGLLLFVPPLNKFFEFNLLTWIQLVICLGISFVAVFWYELVKWRKRILQDISIIV